MYYWENRVETFEISAQAEILEQVSVMGAKIEELEYQKF